MSGFDDLHGDMSNPRPKHEQIDDDLDRLLSGTPLGLDTPAETRLVADVVTALSAPGTADEYLGAVPALLAFRKRFGMSRGARRLRRLRPAMLASLFGTKLAAAAAAGAVGLGGLAAAAYSSALPDTAQNVAHQLINAPSVSHGHGNPANTTTPVGPDPTGSAAFGLCNAYEHAKAHGQSVDHSVAFKNLADAAGGAANIDAFCAQVPHPGSSESAGSSDEPSGPPSGTPNHPTGKPSTHPSHPAGRPTSAPSPSHPTGH